MSILDRIVAQKRVELTRLPSGRVTEGRLRAACEARGGLRGFVEALARPRCGDVGLIAELKKASPSLGVIRADFDPVLIAQGYERAGASCLSVLTDESFFQGSLEVMRTVRAHVSLPLLRKDFIIDDRQILEAVEFGADAILLIASILTEAQLVDFHSLATACGLGVLVEVHDEAELERAMKARPRLLGVNNRDLKTFKVSLETTARLSLCVSKSLSGGEPAPLLVAESGIHSRMDVEKLKSYGAGAILVGESLMKSRDMEAQAKWLIGVGDAPKS